MIRWFLAIQFKLNRKNIIGSNYNTFMNELKFKKLQYPIGNFDPPKTIDTEVINKWIYDIEMFPTELRELTFRLNERELNFKYRPGGWTIKQVVHHCADSHLNSFIRFKLTLTENNPTIRPYFEDRWAEVVDSLDNDIHDSLNLLTALHSKWVKLLQSLSYEELNREFIHPEQNRRISLKENIGLYAWHSNHHLEHIKQALSNQVSFN